MTFHCLEPLGTYSSPSCCGNTSAGMVVKKMVAKPATPLLLHVPECAADAKRTDDRVEVAPELQPTDCALDRCEGVLDLCAQGLHQNLLHIDTALALILSLPTALGHRAIEVGDILVEGIHVAIEARRRSHGWECLGRTLGLRQPLRRECVLFRLEIKWQAQ